MNMLADCVETNDAAVAAIDRQIQRLRRQKRRLVEHEGNAWLKSRAPDCAPLTYHRDTWARAEPEVRVLAPEYWAEVRGESQPLNLDLTGEMYEREEVRGTLVVVTAQVGGKIVGFTGWRLFVHHFYQETLCGIVDSWFLARQYRDGFAGLRLLEFALTELQKEECSQALATTTLTNDVSVLLRRAGFEVVEHIHSKSLEG